MYFSFWISLSLYFFLYQFRSFYNLLIKSFDIKKTTDLLPCWGETNDRDTVCQNATNMAITDVNSNPVLHWVLSTYSNNLHGCDEYHTVCFLWSFIKNGMWLVALFVTGKVCVSRFNCVSFLIHLDEGSSGYLMAQQSPWWCDVIIVIL